MTEFKGIVFSIVSAVIFGLMPIFAKYMYADGCSAAGLLFLRFLFGTIILYLLAKRSMHNPLTISKQQLKEIWILSISFAPTPLLLYLSYNYTSTGAATTLHFVYPACTFLLCRLLYKDEVYRVQWLCLAMVTFGLALFYDGGDAQSMFGLFLAFMSGVIFAFYLTYLSKCSVKTSEKFWMNMHLSIACGIIVLVVAWPLRIFQLPNTLSAWLLAIVFAVLMTVVGGVLLQQGVRYIGAQQAAVFSTFEPLTSIVMGVLFLGESLVLRTGIGIVLILIAVVLLMISGNKQKV